MKIKIISCKYDGAWYKNKIGEILEVKETIGFNAGYDYLISTDGKLSNWGHIYYKDAIRII